MGPADRPVRQILQALSDEAAALAVLADGLQSTIVLLADSPQVRLDTLLSCQSADLLSQRLAGLQLFLGALSRTAPIGWMIDPESAASSLPLADQAACLACVPARADRESSGELEVFDVRP
ncbi:MAG: hypothetical protein JWM33_866 [Caulobacteraceae bacterium]|nr:hypothetical protein [Caulobacteraceae bacterium]